MPRAPAPGGGGCQANLRLGALGGARSSLVPPQPGIAGSWPAVRATAAGAASAWAPCTVTELLFPLPHSFLPFFQLLHFFLVVPVASFGGPSLFFSGRPPLLYLFLLLKLPPPLLLFVLLRVFFTLRGRGGWCFRRRVPPAFAAAAAFAASTSSRVGQSLSDSSSFSEEELRVLVGSGIPTSVHGPAGLTGAELTIGPKGALALEGFFLGGRLKLTPSARQQPSGELVWRRLPPSPAASPKAGLESRPRQQPPAGSWSGELSSPAASLLGSWSGDGTVLASSLPVGSWSGEFVFS